MAKDITKQNNAVHLHGFINEVRMNPVNDEGRMAINLKVCTHEQYTRKDENGEKATFDRPTFHDVTIFTDDKKVIKQYAAIEKDLKSVDNKKNHTVSLDGFLVQRERRVGDSDSTYNTVSIVAGQDRVSVDKPREENEVRNSATFVGNIGSVEIYKEKNFAVVSMANHYKVEGLDEPQVTWLNVRVSGDRKFSKQAYEDLVSGKLGKGDFLRVGGQLHNNTFGEEGSKRYTMVLDLTRIEKLEKKEAEKVEQEKAPAKKTETKKAVSAKKSAKTAAKKTETKKVVKGRGM